VRGTLRTGTAAANAAVSLTIDGQPGSRVEVCLLAVSYSGAPAGGNLQLVGQSSGLKFDIDITAAGPTIINPSEYGMVFDDNEDVVLTLAPAGAGVIGKLNAGVRWTDSEKWTQG
jgi:hypothetical protein